MWLDSSDQSAEEIVGADLAEGIVGRYCLNINDPPGDALIKHILCGRF
jgi:hypothetical protein